MAASIKNYFVSIKLAQLTSFESKNSVELSMQSKASLMTMKYMHQYKQKRWKYFGFVAKINFFLLSLI